MDSEHDAVCLCLAEWVAYLEDQSCLDVYMPPSRSNERAIIILADRRVSIETDIWNLLLEPEILLLTGP